MCKDTKIFISKISVKRYFTWKLSQVLGSRLYDLSAAVFQLLQCCHVITPSTTTHLISPARVLDEVIDGEIKSDITSGRSHVFLENLDIQQLFD